LQAESVEDVQVHRLLDENRSRIQAMGLVHERLYNAQDVAGLCAAEYLHDLVDQLVSIYSGSTPTVFPQIQVDDIVLDIDTAIPCGLILTELVSNSLHHAFAPEGGGEASLRIELLTGEDGWLTLVVADSGLGLPADLDWRHSESLGLQLVSLLVDQLQGTIELDRSAGTAFNISFPTTRQ
jgi:two-component sensor histidine kinase